MRLAYLELGTIVGTHGLRGEVRVHPACDSPAFACRFRTLFKDPAGRVAVRVLAARPHKNVALLTLEGVGSVAQAEQLRSKTLYFRQEDAALEDGQYFIAELLGCSVVDAADETICYGTLCEVSQTRANDVWHIQKPQGGTILIPVIDDVVKNVDIAAGKVKIMPLAGLLD
ncbi:MAG: ribosome maturation factor RimM [Oscillospiraceae bacterium]|nr:ribosome maturation factor RimM [Oscillospiraceae bacterium]